MTNRLFGLGFVCLGGLILLLSSQLPQPLAATRIAYGPGFFPSILGAVIALAGLLMAILNPQEEDGEEQDAVAEERKWTRFVKPAAVMIAALIYIYFSSQIGFLILASVILSGLLLMGRVPVVQAVLIGVLGSILVYILFAKLLLVPLPLGLLVPFGAHL